MRHKQNGQNFACTIYQSCFLRDLFYIYIWKFIKIPLKFTPLVSIDKLQNKQVSINSGYEIALDRWQATEQMLIKISDACAVTRQ